MISSTCATRDALLSFVVAAAMQAPSVGTQVCPVSSDGEIVTEKRRVQGNENNLLLSASPSSHVLAKRDGTEGEGGLSAIAASRRKSKTRSVREKKNRSEPPICRNN